ncbi:MAG: hypothetical protein ACK4SY_08685 [Pyrobaculum sp.]
MPKLKFYDVAARKTFETSSYTVIVKEIPPKRVLVAVARSPYTRARVHRFLGKVGRARDVG